MDTSPAPAPSLQSATTQQANTGAGSSSFSSRNTARAVEVGNRQIANDLAVCCGVADSRAPGQADALVARVGRRECTPFSGAGCGLLCHELAIAGAKPLNRAMTTFVAIRPGMLPNGDLLVQGCIDI